MKFKELDIVKILKDNHNGFQIGDIGVVIMVFTNPNEAYEVEVVNDNGITIKQGTFLAEELELVLQLMRFAI